jgi:mRNA-degrading endonuclease RelE of RelBE toxin-antitoxin system
MTYKVQLESEAEAQLDNIDKSTRIKLLKKLIRLQEENLSRHLKKGLPFFVAEVGQYCICFKIEEQLQEKRVYFIGKHKEYAKWYKAKY